MTEYISKERKEALEQEYSELIGPRRKEIIAAVEHAKSLGDLSENAEYHSAREEQGKLEERIAQIEYLLKHAEVVDRERTEHVDIGATVTIQKEGEGNTRTFLIVGSEETDMLAGKISYKSPLGSALMGKKSGESVVVETPKGAVHYSIVSVQ
jgi:transcription elongation factor GreA